MPPSPFSYVEMEQESRIRRIEDPTRRTNALRLYLPLRELDRLIVYAWFVPTVLSGGAVALFISDAAGFDRRTLAGVALAALCFVVARFVAQRLYFAKAQATKVAEIRSILKYNPELRPDMNVVFTLAPGIGRHCKKFFK
ncbi:MAG TPA: hypothetical protein VLV86_25275 [Vicinamibacterales bacterium]|nr:hypothetical protein [Vicinamibacterales bacterium]